MDIKSFKLVTGEEVVAEVVSVNRALNENLDPNGSSDVLSYSLKRPHILQFQPVGPNQLGLAFIPWTLSNPDIRSVTIPARAIVSVFETANKVEKQYIEQTSGISLDHA